MEGSHDARKGQGKVTTKETKRSKRNAKRLTPRLDVSMFEQLAEDGHFIPPDRVSVIGLSMHLKVDERTAWAWLKECGTPVRKLGAKYWVSFEDLWGSMISSNAGEKAPPGV